MTVIDKKKAYETIGILDISGFEMLTINSLEQLCINYSNEKAQKLFISSYFDEEKTLFEKEGLSKYIADFKPTNNDDVMKMIDNTKLNPKGIFQALDEVIKSNRVDSSVLTEITQALKNVPQFSRNPLKTDRFTIYHSCYPVEYSVKDFVEKGKDELPSNLLSLISKGKPEIGKIISKTLERAMDNTKLINLTDQFRNGINMLMNDLEKSRCNFVRCIKPNTEKAANRWDMPLVLNQLKFLGIKDFLTMKKRMYPLRIDYKEFCKKYIELNFNVNDMFYELEAKPMTDFKDLAKKTYLMVHKDIKESELLLGKKKIFGNYNTFDLMDEKLKSLFAFINSKKELILRLFEKYWLRKNWKIFSANLKRTMGVARVLMGWWHYKCKDYQIFKKVLEMTRAKQWEFRFLRLRRQHRAALQRAKFEHSVFETGWLRYKFLKQKKASWVIQRAYTIIQFRKLVNGRMAVRKLIHEEYETRIWNAILVIIHTKASLSIQNIFRGFLDRSMHSRETEMLEEFKRNYQRIKAANRIKSMFKANYVRRKIRKMVNSTVVLQKNWRRVIKRRAFLNVREATLKIQRFIRQIRFKQNRYDFLLEEKIEAGEFAKWQDLASKEMNNIYSINFVDSIKPSDRTSKKINKKTCNMTFVPEIKPFRMAKLKIYSYILDIDPIIDPKDTYNSHWSIPFLTFLRKAREEHDGNLLGLTVGEAHTMAYTDNSHVYQWGSSNLNQLGLFEPFSKTHPKEANMPIKNNTASYLMAGNNHNVMYSAAQGRLFSWGDNSYGQLGLGHYSTINSLVDISNLLRGKAAKQLDVKADLNCLVLEDGSAQLWPYDHEDSRDISPRHIVFHEQKISTVAVGLDFCCFATVIGKLYTTGKSNSCGELGHGDFMPRYEPTLIQSLAKSGDMAVQISCGLKHVIMRNQNGKVFTWGWGERGQLGHDTDKNLSFPRKVLFKLSGGFSYEALTVQAGYRSSYALLKDRILFQWGTNGQIIKVLTPTRYVDGGNDEIYYKKQDFKPLKICTTWSKSMSVTYMIVGDVRYLTDLNYAQIEELLGNVYKQWERNFYDMKPVFDKKAAVYLDSNIMGQAERAERIAATGANVKSRSKTPTPAEILKRKAEDEKAKRVEMENVNRQNILKHIDMVEKEMKKAKKVEERMNSPKKDASMSKTTDNSRISRAKTPIIGRNKTPSKTNADIKEMGANVDREMRRILAKNPNSWTAFDTAFVEKARKTFGKN